VTVEPSQRGERRAVVEYPGLEIPEIAVAYHRPALGHPDFYALDVMGGILNEGNTARLRMDLFLRGRIGQVRAGNGDSLHPGLFEFSGRPLPGKTLDDVEKGIEDEVRRLREEPVSEKELRRIRTQNAAGLIRSMESNLGLAQILSSYEVLYRWDYIHTYGERVAGITAEDIQRVARKYFTPENRVVVRLVPAAGAADKPKEPGK
jgi:predicted Zn-dependent peptidase